MEQQVQDRGAGPSLQARSRGATQRPGPGPGSGPGPGALVYEDARWDTGWGLERVPVGVFSQEV